MIGNRDDLPSEQRPEEPVGPGRLIHRRDMNQLVVQEDVHAIVAGDRLEGKIQRRDLDRDDVARHDRGAGVSGVGDVGEEEHHRIFRMEIKEAALERERLRNVRAACGTRKRLGRIEIQSRMPARDDAQLRGGGAAKTGSQARGPVRKARLNAWGKSMGFASEGPMK